MQRNMQTKTINTKAVANTNAPNTKAKPNARIVSKFGSKYESEQVVEIRKMKKNMFTDACFDSGILKEKPELDYALYIAYLEVKNELCKNNIEYHLKDKPFQTYVLNYDPKTRSYKSNIVEVETPRGYHYKIVKNQFFTDKNIRDIFYQKISYWYLQKFQLDVKFKAVQINPRTWNCSVKIINPFYIEDTKDVREPDVDETADDGTTCQDLEEAALGMPSN